MNQNTVKPRHSDDFGSPAAFRAAPDHAAASSRPPLHVGAHSAGSERLDGVADRFRDRWENFRTNLHTMAQENGSLESDRLREMVDAVNDQVDEVTGALRHAGRQTNEGLRSAARSTDAVARDNPWAAVTVAAAAGAALAWMLTRR